MATADPKAVDLSAEDHEQVERLLADFDRDWADGQFAAFLGRLPTQGHPLRASALLSLLRIELERQWQNGHEATLETYLTLCPELGSVDTVPVSLILQEYRARLRFGAMPDLAEYAARFPRQGAEMRKLILGDVAAEPFPDATPATPPGPPRVASPRLSSSAFMSPSMPGDPASATMPRGEDGPNLPEQFDRYRILKKLGQGGMGAVYLAHDSKLDRRVALKTPRFSAASDPENLERFYREARATATIHHPNLCPLYDVGEFNGIPYLTMAYIEGWSLSHFVRPDKRLPQAGTAGLVRTVALAIAEAHKHGIIHRDLKPGNILVDKRGQPIVMDFGLARWVHSDKDDVRLTKSGSILGAPVYMSPEQVYGDVENMGPACDIYSLGVILYELLTGRLPFEGNTTAVLAKTLMQPPTPPSKHRPDLDPRLETICLKAMSKAIHDRFPSMAEMANALTEFLRADKKERESAGAGTGSLPPFAPSRSPGPDGSGLNPGFPAEPPSGSRQAERTTPSPSGSETLAQQPASDARKRTARGVIPTSADDTSPLADPSISMVRRVSPKPPPQLKHIRRPRRKGRLIAGVAALMLAATGAAAWFFWPKPSATSLQVSLTPADANVSVEIDDRVIDPNLLAEPYAVTPGAHVLVVAGTGFERFRQEITVEKGESKALSIELKRLPVKVAIPQPQLGPAAPLQEPFVEHKRPVRCVAITADGKQAISGGDDSQLVLWDMQTHKKVFAVKASDQPVTAYAFSADGRRGVSSDTQRRLRLWHLSSETRIAPTQIIGPVPTDVHALAVSTAGDKVVFGGADAVVYAWEGIPALKELKGVHSRPIRAVALTADGSLAASGGEDGLIVLWDMKDPQKTRKLTGHGGAIRTLVFSRDGKRLVSGGDDHSVRMWDVAKASEMKRYTGHSGTVRCVAFTWDEKQLVSAATGPFDNAVRLWEVASGNMVRVVGRHKDGAYAVACCGIILKDRALSGGDDGSLRLWDTTRASVESAMPTTDTLVEVSRIREKAAVRRVVVSPDGRRIVTAGSDGVGRICNAATGKLLLELKAGPEPLCCVDFSPNGKLVLTGGADKKVRVWNAETGALVWTFGRHNGAVRGGVFTADSRLVLSAGDDKNALLWKAETGEIVQTFDNQQAGAIHGVAISPDGKRVLTASDNGSVGVWDVVPEQKGKFVKAITTSAEAVLGVAFLADGKGVVTIGRDRSLRVWNLDTAKEEARFDGHVAPITGLAVAPGRRRLLTAGQDGTVFLWDLPSKRLLARYTGHAGPVGGLAFSADGSQAITAGTDLTLRVLDLPRSADDPPPLTRDRFGSQEARELKGHTKAVESVAFSRDGKRVFSASVDGTLRAWNVIDGKPAGSFDQHKMPVHSVAVSRDGKLVLSGGYDKRIRLWDAVKLTVVADFAPPDMGPVEGVAFSPNNKRAVTGGRDKLVRIWDVEKKVAGKVCMGHTAPVWAVAFLADNKYVLSASIDRTIRKWDADTGKEVAKWQAPGELHALAVSPDGRRALSAGKDSAITLWETATGQQLASFVGHSNTVAGVAFSPDGRWALSGGEDKTARLWDAATGQEVGRYLATDAILGLAFSPDGKTAVLGGRNNSVRLWTLPEFTAVAPTPAINEGVPLERLAVSPDGNLILLVGADGVARLWDGTTGKTLRQYKGHDGAVHSAAFSPDGKRVCTAGADGTVRVWSVDRDEEILKINAHPKVWSAVFSPDGSQILTCGEDGVARLWNATDGKVTHTFGKHDKPVLGIAFTPDGLTALTASADEKFAIGVWDTTTGKLVRRLEQKGASSVVVSADGRFALTGGLDKTVKLWLLETGELLQNFDGHNGAVTSTAMSPDGRFALTASADKTIRMWDVRYGKPVRTYAGPNADVSAAVFFGDGKQFATVSRDRTLRLWAMPAR